MEFKTKFNIGDKYLSFSQQPMLVKIFALLAMELNI